MPSPTASASTSPPPSASIILELAHAESGIGGQGRLVEQQQVVEPVDLLAKTGNDPWVPLAGFVLLLAAFTTRRLVAARVRRHHRAVGAVTAASRSTPTLLQYDRNEPMIRGRGVWS